jgi:hypothetical protein
VTWILIILGVVVLTLTLWAWRWDVNVRPYRGSQGDAEQARASREISGRLITAAREGRDELPDAQLKTLACGSALVSRSPSEIGARTPTVRGSLVSVDLDSKHGS